MRPRSEPGWPPLMGTRTHEEATPPVSNLDSKTTVTTLRRARATTTARDLPTTGPSLYKAEHRLLDDAHVAKLLPSCLSPGAKAKMEQQKQEQEQESYILGRTFSANARLNLQYFLWKDGGFSLHPSIPATTKNLRVAEIGVGTGIWLVDLARNLPECAKIDGFDINLTQCPPAEWLPSNVSVHEVDCLGPLPDDLIGQYDIVHIQLFHLAVHNNDPAPIIKNLIRLLKPGGWISWGEIDYSRWQTVRTKEGQDTVDNITQLLALIGTVGGTRPNWAADDWPSRLHLLFAENGLENVEQNNRLFPLDLLVFQLDTALMASEEVSYKVLDPIRNGSGDRCRALISDVFRDRQKLAYNVGRLTVVGQKPL